MGMATQTNTTTVTKVFSEEFKKEIKAIPANAFKLNYVTEVVPNNIQMHMAALSGIVLAALIVKGLL